MMRSPLFWIATAVVLMLLGISMAANVILFREARNYYVELNYVRVDPLALLLGEMTPTATDTDALVVALVGDSRMSALEVPARSETIFLNWGAGGQTTAQTLGRYEQLRKRVTPDIVVVQVGINDLKTLPLFPGDAEQIIVNTEQALRDIVAQAREDGADVILMTIIPAGSVPLTRQIFWSDAVGQAVNRVNATIHTLADDDVLILDAAALLSDASGLLRADLSEDFLHLNDEGESLLVAELFESLSALQTER